MFITKEAGESQTSYQQLGQKQKMIYHSAVGVSISQTARFLKLPAHKTWFTMCDLFWSQRLTAYMSHKGFLAFP